MATVQSILASSWPRDIGGGDIAICSLIYFYVHGAPLNRTGEVLNRILRFTTRLIFQVDTRPPSLQAFKALLEAALQGVDESYDINATEIKEGIVAFIASSLADVTGFSSLHGFFAKAERLLLREEMFDEMQNMTVTPPERQLDETSPFGVHLQLCLESYLALEDEEFARLVRRMEAWVGGTAGDDVVECCNVPSADTEIEVALRKGDYATARAGLEGSFDRAPLASVGRSLPATLLQTARFHVSTHALQAARASLDEALKLARGSNDVRCISACDDLFKQLDFEEAQLAALTVNRPTRASGGKYDHLRDARRDMSEGTPLMSVLRALEEFDVRSAAARPRPLNQLPSGGGPGEATWFERNLIFASMWDTLGCPTINELLLDVCEDESGLAVDWLYCEQKMAIAVHKARARTLASDYVGAMMILTDGQLLRNLDIEMLQAWHREILRTLLRSALATDAMDAVEEIVALRPEVLREVGEGEEYQWAKSPNSKDDRPNEASFMRSERLTFEQSLRQRLLHANRLRRTAKDNVKALLVASEVMDGSRKADLFALYREAIYESAEANLGLGQSRQTCDLLEDILPAALTDSSPGLAGKVCWLYARALLALNKETEKDEGYQHALTWLHRADSYLSKAGLLKDLQDTRHAMARIYHHLGMHTERDAVAESYSAVKEERSAAARGHVEILRRVQHIAANASARVVAGG